MQPWERAAQPEVLLLAKQGYLALAECSRAKAQGYHSLLQGSLLSVQALLQSLGGQTEQNGAMLEQGQVMKLFPAVMDP